MTEEHDPPMARILLSGPDTNATDREALLRAFDSGWIAPLGPEVDAFETELATATDRRHAVALTSGTAALHLALIEVGVGPGDFVAAPTLTFAATVNPIRYCGAEPFLIDSEPDSWGMAPDRLQDAMRATRASGRLLKAVIGVDLFGQCFNHAAVTEICRRYGVPLIVDAAESLGAATSSGRPSVSTGELAVVSFNGNKMITTSGGGALLTDDAGVAERARTLASQARLPVPHYEHEQLGFNYRLSNLLAGLGRSQLARLEEKVARRRAIRETYRAAFADLPGIALAQESGTGEPNAWLTVITVDPDLAGIDATRLRQELDRHEIEARAVWKPMHRQPLYARAPALLNGVSDRAFETGTCLPSGSALTDDEVATVTAAVRAAVGRAVGSA